MATYTNSDINYIASINGSPYVARMSRLNVVNNMNNMNNNMNNSVNNNAVNANGLVPSKRTSKCVYIGKVKNTVTSVDIRSDRIVLVNTYNQGLTGTAKYNITIPFVEITALRFCNEREISIFVIQPIYESYIKLSNWVRNSNGITRAVPENFIMIHFDAQINMETMNNIHRDYKVVNPRMKIVEINSVFAHSYLNTPNKLMTNTRTPRPTKTVPTEVIHLDDDDDEEPKKNDTMLHRTILKYPENGTTQIIIYGNDLNCLRDGQYLNDNIMNFYLKYFQYNGNLGQNEDGSAVTMDRMHIYDTLFSNHLLQSTRKRTRIDLGPKSNLVAYTTTPFEETYQKELKKWTKDVDIFSKDFLIIPLIKDSHWFLAILCYIGNLIPLKNGQAIENTPKEPLPKPTFIFMDSLNVHGAAGISSRKEITKTIYKYLDEELKEKRKNAGPLPEFTQSPKVYLELHPKVPQQQNYYDCGLFVLEYIEKFLTDPEKIYNTILKNAGALDKWFSPKSLDTKRAKIRQIILNLLPPEDARKLEAELLHLNLNVTNNDMNHSEAF